MKNITNQMSRSAVTRCIAIASSATLALGLAACGGDGSGDGDGDGGGTINIAMVAPLSGDAASYGLEVQQGIKLAVKDINADGGIDGKKLKLDFYDDKCDPTAGATAANAVVSKEYVAVVGSVCSVALQAGIPIYERAKLPIIAASVSSPALAGIYDGFNRIIPADDKLVESSIKLAVKVLGFKKVGVLYPADDYGQSANKEVGLATKKYGGEVVAAETYTVGQTNDYGSVLSNIAAKNPDVFHLAGYYADMGAAVKQTQRAFGGKKFPIVSTSNVQVQEYIDLAGAAGEGTWIATIYDPQNPSDANATFKKDFAAEYDKQPGTQGAIGYDNIMVLKAAIESKDGATDDLFDAIRGVEYEGLSGNVKFNDDGDNDAGVNTVLQLKDGQWVIDVDKSAEMIAAE